MSSRSSKWLLSERANDKWDLSKGGRTYYTGISKQEAIQRLSVHYKSGERVLLEELDGYQTNITEQLKRARIIK